jgi:hypothetical protein
MYDNLYLLKGLKMRTKLMLILILSFLEISYSQTAKLVGTWKLVKHITTYQGDTNYDCLKLLQGSTGEITFNADGSYNLTWTDKKGGTTGTIGQWKMSSDNKKLTLFRNDFFPKNPMNTMSDRTYDIVKLTTTEFQFKENMCTEAFEGISYFIRSN